jgi:hypothetical protein
MTGLKFVEAASQLEQLETPNEVPPARNLGDGLDEHWCGRPGSNPAEALFPLPQLGNVTGTAKLLWFSSYEWK